MGAEFENGNPQTHRSVLGDDDMNLNGNPQTHRSVLGDDSMNSEADEWDQNENGQEQNEMKNNKNLFLPREHNNDYKKVEKVLMPQEHNNENACNEL